VSHLNNNLAAIESLPGQLVGARFSLLFCSTIRVASEYFDLSKTSHFKNGEQAMGIHDCFAWLGTRGRGATLRRSPRGAQYPILLALLALAAGLPGPAAAQISAANVSNVDFGPQPVGTTAGRVIEITNASTDPAEFLEVGSLCSTGPIPCSIGIGPSFSVVAQTCYETSLGTFVASYPIGPGGFCTISIEFTPTSVGNPGATLLVASNGSITPLAIALSGDAVAPTTPVTIAPSPLTFPPQPAGVPTTQYLTLTNTTKYEVTVNSVFVSGANAPSFMASSVQCGSLAPGGQCPVSVTFMPKTANAQLQATVSIYVSSSSTSTPNTASNNVVVQGSSLNGSPLISLSPGYVTFQAAPVGTTTTQYITIGNTGTAPLLISSIIAQGLNNYSFFQGHPVVNNCFGPVPVNGSCMITVNFIPQQTGLLTESINITSNSNEGYGDAGLGITRINLSGTGLPSSPATTHLTITPSITAFGVQPTGTTSAEEGVYLLNNTAAPFPLSSGSVTLGGNNPDSFAIKFNQCTSTLAVGDACSVVVTFTPLQGSNTLPGTPLSANIFVNGYARPLLGLLTGYGINPTQNLTVSPAAGLSFGSQVYGTTSAPQTLTVTNTTNKSAVKVSSVNVGGSNAGSFAVSSLCGGYVSLAPGASCTLNVTFRPQSAPAATLSAMLNVVGSVGGPSGAVSLTGSSTVPKLPLVGGESLAKATADLTALGYEVETVTTAPSAKPAGEVTALVPTAAGGTYGAPVGLTVSAGASAPAELTIERAVAQAGLSIGLASNLTQSQSWILTGLNDELPECTPLAYSGNAGYAGNLGSAWSQGTPSAVWIFSDGACSQPYIQAIATQMPNGEYSETATYYPLGTTLLQLQEGTATKVGTLTFTMAAPLTTSGAYGISGIGTFTVSGSGQTVQVGLSCTVPAISSLPCAGGIVQDFPDAVIGSLIPVGIDVLDSAGIGSSEYFAPLGTPLTLTNPNATSPPFMDITGSSVSFESYSHYGAAGSITVFPTPPTGWTVMDSTSTYQLQITESETTGGYSLEMIAPNGSGVGVLSQVGTVDAAGNGTITYTDGTPATITNWILSDN
jgi:Transmembrane protein 131-like N-terminal/Abnormal spindle-like microcephaly-assoc'd, ASPM-SPD-2-Hydin